MSQYVICSQSLKIYEKWILDERTELRKFHMFSNNENTFCLLTIKWLSNNTAVYTEIILQASLLELRHHLHSFITATLFKLLIIDNLVFILVTQDF